ncbi:MAG: alpha/beta hydrolase [Parachlamydiales bacterium]|jgi:pimeloyl-ACP methyl ester carboxylesterase
MTHIQLRNANYYYELTGEGEPIVLISGYSCDHAFWEPVVENLKAKFTLLTFDNRGIGQTTDQGGRLSLQLLTEDVLEIIEQLGLIKPHIVGHSMGGAIAQTIAAKAEQQIGKMAIINSTSKLREATLCALESLLKLRKKGVDFDTLFESSYPWFYGDEFLSDKSNIEKLKAAVLQNPFPQTLEGQERQIQILKDAKKIDLKNISTHSLVVYGTQDLVTLPSESMELANKILNSTLKKLNSGHASVQENPQQIADFLLDHFKR